MTEDQDSADEVVAATVRVALTAAGQLAEQAARRREAALREAERDSAARVATLQAQLAAERQLGRHAVRDVLQRGATASVEELAHAWQQISSWDDSFTCADRVRLDSLVMERFGVDPDHLIGAPLAAGAVPPAPRDVPAAAALLATDHSNQRGDARDRVADDREGATVAHLGDAGLVTDVAEAWALASQSHPTPPALAARPPAAVPRGRRGTGARRYGVEVQDPSR